MAKKGKARASVHLLLDQFRLDVHSFRSSIVEFLGESSAYGGAVERESTGERVEAGQVLGSGMFHWSGLSTRGRSRQTVPRRSSRASSGTAAADHRPFRRSRPLQAAAPANGPSRARFLPVAGSAVGHAVVSTSAAVSNRVLTMVLIMMSCGSNDGRA